MNSTSADVQAETSSITSLPEFVRDPNRLVAIVPPGCYYAWIFLVCFTPIVFGEADMYYGAYAVQLVASLVGYLMVLLLRITGVGPALLFSERRALGVAALASVASAGILALRLAADFMTLLPAVGLFAFVAAAAIAYNHVSWISYYGGTVEGDAPCIIGGFMILSFVVTVVGVALPQVPAYILIALLPLASGLALTRLGEGVSSRIDEGLARPAIKAAYSLPSGLLFGVVAMGLVYGLSQDFSLVYAHRGSAVAFDCLLANGIVGVLVIVYSAITGKNFGYSALCLAIVPIAGMAQGMIAVFRADLLVVSFFFMRFAYMLFDAMLWLQLPRVFGRLRSVRIFLLVRLAFEGSLLAAVGFHKFLMLFDFVVFDWVVLVCLGLLLLALTLALANDNVGTAWNLMPVRVPYTGKFRRACRSIEEEYRLTKRESEVLELVLRGRSGPYIEEKLFISKNTFQTHMRNVYKKMDIHSQQDLIDLLERRMDEHRAREEGVR